MKDPNMNELILAYESRRFIKRIYQKYIKNNEIMRKIQIKT